MKKVNLIMTMLVMMMGVSFMTNAQTAFHTVNDFDDVNVWQFDGNGSYTVNIPSSNHVRLASDLIDAHMEMVGTFDATIFVDKIDVLLYFAAMSSESDLVMNVYISDDNVNWSIPVNTTTEIIYGNSNSNVIHEIALTGANFDDVDGDGYVYIKIEMDGILGTWTQMPQSPQFYTSISGFQIKGNDDPTASISENELSNDLNIYSYDKSVFLEASESMNANVSVYTMSGQVVNNENMNISTSRTEMNLSHLNSGIYIINVISGNRTSQKKVFIK